MVKDANMSESLPQDNVMSLTANLAERQAAATQLPRLSTGANVSPKENRAGSSEARKISESPLRQRGHRFYDKEEDGPKVDEAAIARMTNREEEEENLTRREDDELSDSFQNTRHTSRQTKKSGISISSTDSVNLKRMTVLIDGETPSNEEEGNVDKDDDENSQIEEVAGEAENEEEEEEVAPEEEILEQDADEGEEDENAAKDGFDGTEEEENNLAAETTNKEEPRLMDSIATLQAHPRSSDHMEEVAAVGESSEEQLEMEEEEEEPTLKYSRLKASVPDILKKDSASALAVSDRVLALGTHSGAIYILDEQGNLIKGFRSHSASVLDLVIDTTSEFIGSAGMDGLVSIASLSSSESYTFDFKRVMRAIALEPSFGRRTTRSFVCGGMAGQLVLREKSWFGHRETILHEGEGPIWATKWKSNIIAWVTDRGVRLYDVTSRQRIGLISPPLDNPRADLFRCNVVWQDDTTLLIAWADHIKIAKIRQRKKRQATTPAATSASTLQLFVEVTTILQLDCMISGISPRGKDYLILAYITEEDDYSNDSLILNDRDAQKRKDGLRPELRLISNDGEELSSDVLSLESFARFQCNDYLLVPSADAVHSGANAISPNLVKSGNKSLPLSIVDDANLDYFYVISPKDIVIARSRDEKDHIDWLLQHRHYEEALQRVEAMNTKKATVLGFNAESIGKRYLNYLIQDQQDYSKASKAAPSILKKNAQAWEDIVFTFIEKQQLNHIIPFVPIEDPTLSRVIYDMILAHFLRFDLQFLYDTVRKWPSELYSTRAVVLAIEDRLNGESSAVKKILMECLAEVYIKNRQPGKALPYFLRLRKPGVFDLIREHNLFTVVQDQALLLVEFEEDIKQDKQTSKHCPAIDLLVDHTHSIPIQRVVSQLQAKPIYLYKYLDALFDRDPQQVASYSDIQVNLYAEYEYSKLMAYLRAMSSYYSFEKAYTICKQFNYIPEMVFLLSRIGDNKTALTLIIEGLQDVERAIEFVKEEKDADLWEDLIRYSEDKPRFIKGLLENVGSEVDAVKLIKRIKNGLEIEGLKAALIKILSDFNLQISLLEGCEAILSHDGRSYSSLLHQGQSQGQYCDKDSSICLTCGKNLFENSSSAPQLVINNVLFLCRHGHHISCLVQNLDSIPKFSNNNNSNQPTSSSLLTMNTTQALASGHHHTYGPYGPKVRSRQVQVELQDRLRFQNRLRVLLKKGCPICLNETSSSGLI